MRYSAWRNRQETGQAAIEMAIALPLILFIILVGLVIGLSINARVGLTNAAHEVGRLAAVSTDTSALKDQAQQAVTGAGLPLSANGITYFDPNKDTTITRNQDGTVTVKLNYRQSTFVPLIGKLVGAKGFWGDTLPITAQATFKDETANAGTWLSGGIQEITPPQQQQDQLLHGPTVAIAAGGGSTYALKQDGTFWSWGNNIFGQLGDETTTGRSRPAQVQDLSDVTEIAVGGGSAYALKQDGTVLAWGRNDRGQLGDGTITAYNITPKPVPGLSGVTAIAANNATAYALKQDGTVWSWGYNMYLGQLGDGTTVEYRSTPVQVKNLSGVIAIAASRDSAYAIKQDGTVWAWGYNQFGQLGDGTIENNKNIPVQVKNLSGVTAIAAGDYSAYALTSDGTVWAWGFNGNKQLGDETTIGSSTPKPVPGLSGVTAIAAGSESVYALKQDGTVWDWGYNQFYQLGDGTKTNNGTPKPVPGLSGVTAIAARGYSAYAIKQDGTVWSWGSNSNGQLGDGTTTNRPTPVQVQIIVPF